MVCKTCWYAPPPRPTIMAVIRYKLVPLLCLIFPWQKNKTTSLRVTDQSLQIDADSSIKSSQPLVGSERPRVNTQQEDEERPMTREHTSWQDSTGRSGTSHHPSFIQGVDVETQAPSPLMQTWRGATPAASQDINRNDDGLRPHGSSHQLHHEEPADSGYNQLEAVHQSTGETPTSHSAFEPDLHSTAYGADSRLAQGGQKADAQLTRTGRKTTSGGDGRNVSEPEMDLLNLQDLDDQEDYSPYAHHHHMKQPGQTLQHAHPAQNEHIPEHVDFTQPNQRHGDSVSNSGRPPPPTYQSTFRFAMQIPMLLSVPPERLAQGSLGAAGVRYMAPPQGMTQPHSVGPSVSRPPAPNVTSADARHSNVQSRPDNASQYEESYRAPPCYFSNHNKKADSQIAAESARNAQTHPHAELRFNPAAATTASDHPIRHLASLLHPGAQQQYSSGTLPPIPLLHMVPRYKVPTIPPPTYPNLGKLYPSHPADEPLSNTTNHLLLLKLQTGAKSTQFVPLEELSAFERTQRQGKEKHPAVRAREMYEQKGGREDGCDDETLGPIQLLHADLKNDLNNVTRWVTNVSFCHPIDLSAAVHHNPVLTNQICYKELQVLTNHIC